MHVKQNYMIHLNWTNIPVLIPNFPKWYFTLTNYSPCSLKKRSNQKSQIIGKERDIDLILRNINFEGVD